MGQNRVVAKVALFKSDLSCSIIVYNMDVCISSDRKDRISKLSSSSRGWEIM